jgi:hypothetical protein
VSAKKGRVLCGHRTSRAWRGSGCPPECPGTGPGERAEAMRKMAIALGEMAGQGKVVVAALRALAVKLREVGR